MRKQKYYYLTLENGKRERMHVAEILWFANPPIEVFNGQITYHFYLSFNAVKKFLKERPDFIKDNQ